MDSKHVTDDLPALALDCLEAAERQQVLAHLEECDQCRAEWTSYSAVVGVLSTALPQVTPPARLKRAVMDGITPPRPVNPLIAALRRAFSGQGGLLRAGGLALVLILAVSNLVLWQRVNDLGRMQHAGYDNLVLQSQEEGSAASGMVIYTADGRYGLLVVNKLEPLPADQQYQLWLIKDGVRASGGVFSVGKHGYHVMEIYADGRLTDYDSFGITIEPAGGSPGPTGKRVLAGSF